MNYLEASRRKAEELRTQEKVRILSLETSCDETAAAVIENGRKILSIGGYFFPTLIYLLYSTFAFGLWLTMVTL